MAAQCSRNRDGIPPAVSFWNPCAAQPHRKMDLLSVSACDLLIKGSRDSLPIWIRFGLAPRVEQRSDPPSHPPSCAAASRGCGRYCVRP
jgi:hypothetical protein